MKDIEYYKFEYCIPVYKMEPNETFYDYYQLHKDEIIVELDKEIQDLKQRLNVVNEMNVANYNKYCEVLSILAQLEGWLIAEEQNIGDSKQKPVFGYVLKKLNELKGGIRYEQNKDR